MNAGGVHNTFKSNGVKCFGTLPSGGRVSNAGATCPYVRDTNRKQLLIPNDITELHGSVIKDLLHRDGLASD